VASSQETFTSIYKPPLIHYGQLLNILPVDFKRLALPLQSGCACKTGSDGLPGLICSVGQARLDGGSETVSAHSLCQISVSASLSSPSTIKKPISLPHEITYAKKAAVSAGETTAVRIKESESAYQKTA
jgi:hypothetical protein